MRVVLLTSVACLVVMNQATVSWANPGSMQDWIGFEMSRAGADGATGIIRSTTTTRGTSSSVSSTYPGPRRAAKSSGPSAGSLVPQQQSYIDPSTGRLVQMLTNFIPNGAPAAAPAAVGAVSVPPVVLAREAAATLQLPVQTVRIGPEPSLNRWNMLAVGYPLWLWREGAGTISESVALGGASLSMTATYQSTTYDMGDGTRVTCSASTPWVAGAQAPGSPSPTCGHSYKRPGTYTITATHTWNLSWSGLGESGSFPLTNVSSTTVQVGELASVVVGR